MAISLDLNNSQYGIPFQGAYFRIVTAAISRQRDSNTKFVVMIDVSGYGTNTPNDNTREIDFRRYYVDLSTIESQTASAFLDKCYTWIMSQPDMNGSVRV